MSTNYKICKKPEEVQSTNVFKNIKFGKNCLLENDSNTSTVKFEKEIVKTRETRSELVRNKEEGSHQNQNKRRIFEDNCEDKPSKKKFGIGIGGGASVRNLNFENTIAKTAEMGGGGKND